MRRMRLAPEAIDDPQLDPPEGGQRRVVEFGNVGGVRKPADPQTESRAEPVVLCEWNDRNTGDLERTSDLMRLQSRFVKPARLWRRLQDIPEPPADLRQGLRIGK